MNALNPTGRSGSTGLATPSAHNARLTALVNGQDTQASNLFGHAASLNLSGDRQELFEQLETMMRGIESDIRSFQQELDNIRQSNEEAARLNRIKVLTLKIARRIINGDNVPKRDEEFLAYHDRGLYNTAIQLRNLGNDDPTDYDSLTRNEDRPSRTGSISRGADGSISISVPAPANVAGGRMNITFSV